MPRHFHHEQDEWLYVVEGQIECEIGGRRLTLGESESVFVPRTVAHWWGSVAERPSTVLEVYQPAGRLEQFFREVGQYTDPPIHEALSVDEMVRLFDAHGMCCSAPDPSGMKARPPTRLPPDQLQKKRVPRSTTVKRRTED